MLKQFSPALLSTLAPLVTAPSLLAQLPISGEAVPELEEFEDVMTAIVEDYDIGAGLLAIAVEGEVVYRRGFGWADEARTVPVGDDATWRLASLSKPFTATVIHALADRGALSLNDTVFGPEGLLDLVPYEGEIDPLLETITVRDLLAHQGGWDWELSGDHTYREIEITEELGLDAPPSREQTVRWILGKPLDFPPGTRYAYANTGYLVLGLVAEAVGGEDLVDLVHRLVLAPSGLGTDSLFAGNTFQADADLREPFYDSVGQTGPNVFSPTQDVPLSYGGWNHEVRVAQGGMVANADAVIALMAQHRIVGEDVGGSRPGAGAWEELAIGSLVGSQTEAVEHGSGIDFVVFLNRRDPAGADLVGIILDQLDAVLEDSEIDWDELRSQAGEAPRWVYLHDAYLFDPVDGSRSYLEVGRAEILDGITGSPSPFSSLGGWLYLNRWPKVYWQEAGTWVDVDTTTPIWAYDYYTGRWSPLGSW